MSLVSSKTGDPLIIQSGTCGSFSPHLKWALKMLGVPVSAQVIVWSLTTNQRGERFCSSSHITRLCMYRLSRDALDLRLQ